MPVGHSDKLHHVNEPTVKSYQRVEMPHFDTKVVFGKKGLHGGHVSKKVLKKDHYGGHVSKKALNKGFYGGHDVHVLPRKQRISKVSESRSYGRSVSPKLGLGVAKVSHSRSYSDRSLSPKHGLGLAKVAKVSESRSYGRSLSPKYGHGPAKIAKVSRSRSYGRSLSPKLGLGVAKVAKVSESRSYGRSLSPKVAQVKHSRSYSAKKIVKTPKVIKSHILPRVKHGELAIGVSKGLSRSYKKIGHGGHTHGSYGYHDHAHGDYGHFHLDHDHDHGHGHGHVHSHGIPKVAKVTKVAKVSHSRSYSPGVAKVAKVAKVSHSRSYSPKIVEKSHSIKKVVSHDHGLSRCPLALAKSKKAIKPIKVVEDHDYLSDSTDDKAIVVDIGHSHSHGLDHVDNHMVGPHEHGHYGLHDHSYGEHDHTHAHDGSIIYKTDFGILRKKDPYVSKKKPLVYQCRSKNCAHKTGTKRIIHAPVKVRSF